MLSMGLYQWDLWNNTQSIRVRLVAAFVLGFAMIGLGTYLVPSLHRGPLALGATVIALALAGSLLVRAAFDKWNNASAFKSRVLVLGTGSRVAKLAEYAKHNPNHRGGRLCLAPAREAFRSLAPGAGGRAGRVAAVPGAEARDRPDRRRGQGPPGRRASGAATAGVQGEGRQGRRAADLLRTRVPAGDAGVPESELDGPRGRLSPERLRQRGEAPVRPDRERRTAARVLARPARRRPVHLSRERLARALPAGTGRPGRARLHALQIAQHAERCGAHRRRTVGDGQRRSHHPGRANHPQVPARRVAADLQRASRAR